MKKTTLLASALLALLVFGGQARAQISTPPLRIYDETTPLGLAFKLKMAGAGVTCTGPAGGFITCTIAGGGGSGTVTSVTCGTGLSGGTFTTTGTCSLNTALGVNLVPTDLTYSIGDATHRLSNLAASSILGGAAAITITTTVAHGGARGGLIVNDQNASGTDKPLLVESGGSEILSVAGAGSVNTQGSFIVQCTTGNGIFGSTGVSGMAVCYSDLADAVYGGPIGPYVDFDAGEVLGSATRRWAVARLRHLIGAVGTKPTCAPGTGAGTGGACSTLTGSTDIAGTLEVVAGTGPAGSSTVATVTFNTAYEDSAPRCTFSPANGSAAGLTGVDALYLDQSAATTAVFVMKNATVTGIAGSTTYDWNYKCIQ